MNKEDFLSKYWNYYLMLEDKVISLQNYIDFENDNLNVYSFEIHSKLMMVCCEIESVYKLIVGEAKANVEEYVKIILQKEEYKDLKDDTVEMIDYGKITFKPVSCAVNKNKNGWWDSYNLLKHNKLENNNYKNANLRNLIYALASLYLLEIRFYNKHYYDSSKHEENIPYKESKLFVSNMLKANFESSMGCIIVDSW